MQEPNHHRPGSEPDTDRAMQDVWNRTLAQIATTFGKMVYLAELRDANSGAYHHYGLAQRYSEETADRVLRTSHEQVFSEWLTYSLERQRRDLEQYLESLEGDRETLLQTWLTLTPYRNVIPIGAREAERLLYISDLELILDLLRNELSS